jgi:hypothetical protein
MLWRVPLGLLRDYCLCGVCVYVSVIVICEKDAVALSQVSFVRNVCVVVCVFFCECDVCEKDAMMHSTVIFVCLRVYVCVCFLLVYLDK